MPSLPDIVRTAPIPNRIRGILRVGLLADQVALPVALAEPLAHPPRDQRALAVGHLVHLLEPVQADAGAELLELLAVRVGTRLPPGLNGRGLLPMFLLFDPPSQYVGA